VIGLENLTRGDLAGEAIQILASALLVHILYGTFRTKYALVPLAIPFIIDSDHLLSIYSEGIKAFHSMFFITLIASPFICFGLVKMHREAIFAGAVVYVVSVLNISIDLLQGGIISFLYPFSNSAYVLNTSLSPDVAFGGMMAILFFTMSAAYAIHESLWGGERTGAPFHKEGLHNKQSYPPNSLIHRYH